ncbi:fucose permease [Oxalobacteraceae bacterium GrIS 1.11]
MSKAGARRDVKRDQQTWFLYLLLVVYGFKQSVLGSVMPFLRDELHYDTLQIGWHFSIYALGLVISGFLSGFLLTAQRIDALVRLSAIAMIVAVLSLMFAHNYSGTLAAPLAMGLTGGIVQASVQAGIAWHQGENRDMAMVEAFIFGGLGVFSGPLLVGQVAAAGLNWRLALLIPALALLALLLIFRGGALTPSAHPCHAGARVGVAGAVARGALLPILLCWLMVILGIAAEWGLGFWGAQFLESRLGLAPAAAVSLMAVFFGGTVCGRLVSSRLLGIFDGRSMLYAVIFLGGGAIFALWSVPQLASTVLALAVAGMCLGNFFPLILSSGIRAAPDRVGLVSVGATQAVGVALLVVPIGLGMLVALPVLMALALFFTAPAHPAQSTLLSVSEHKLC